MREAFGKWKNDTVKRAEAEVGRVVRRSRASWICIVTGVLGFILGAWIF